MLTTSHSYQDYVFSIRHEATDPAYVVEFPDIPEIITSADTLADAFANACEALDLHLESLQQLDLPAPARRHRLIIEAA
jgi:predicted RNase H-like HicB family nuclease